MSWFAVLVVGVIAIIILWENKDGRAWLQIGGGFAAMAMAFLGFYWAFFFGYSHLVLLWIPFTRQILPFSIGALFIAVTGMLVHFIGWQQLVPWFTWLGGHGALPATLTRTQALFPFAMLGWFLLLCTMTLVLEARRERQGKPPHTPRGRWSLPFLPMGVIHVVIDPLFLFGAGQLLGHLGWITPLAERRFTFAAIAIVVMLLAVWIIQARDKAKIEAALEQNDIVTQLLERRGI